MCRIQAHRSLKLQLVIAAPAVLHRRLPPISGLNQTLQNAELNYVFQTGAKPPPPYREVEVSRFVSVPASDRQEILEHVRCPMEMKMRFGVLVRRLSNVVICEDRSRRCGALKGVRAPASNQVVTGFIQVQGMQDAKVKLRGCL